MNADDNGKAASNVVRHVHRDLTEYEKGQIKIVKDAGLEFIEVCDMIGKGREMSLAKTKIEEAVFWAVKSITA